MAARYVDALLKRANRECGPLVARTIEEMRGMRQAMDLLSFRRRDRPPIVGFVPTMGALHEGHLSLCKKARLREPNAEKADFLVSSIFVNPTQFAPHEDLRSYPRTWESDLKQLDAQGVDVVFHPSSLDMYPPGAPHRTFIDLSGFDEGTPEGGARPGFFRGVATVVTKLFSIVEPTHACFGQKDGMQCIAVRQLVRDLNLRTEVDILPTQRATDGLALSSRNAYLNPDERRDAPAIYSALNRVTEHIKSSQEGRDRLARADAALRGRRASATACTQADAEAAAQKAAAHAQAARSAHVARSATSVSPPEDEYLRWLRSWASDMIIAEGAPSLGPVQYLVFSDALTGAHLSRIEDSTARNGAVMLSVAVQAGRTRLLDNVLVVGSVDDIGATPFQ